MMNIGYYICICIYINMIVWYGVIVIMLLVYLCVYS